MILKSAQRAISIKLARHLLKTVDNGHVDIHELKGFVADDLKGALKEIYAVTKGTTGQPRAIEFHEKEGRRHAHCVWSRIDSAQMKAISLPHFKLKLRDISRQLYLENNWQMPRGLMNSEERNPLNFTQAEWQQAQRIGQDPRQLKQIFQDCWAVSDSRNAFANALKERGLFLAQGDRRGFVAVDWRREVYAISRWVGVKTKEVRARLGHYDDLSTIGETKTRIAEQFTEKLRGFCSDQETRHHRQLTRLTEKRTVLVTQQRKSRTALRQEQATRRTAETKARAEHLPTGLQAPWFRVTGKYRKILQENETQARASAERDRREWQQFIERQQRERRALQHEFRQLRHHHSITLQKLHRDLGIYLERTGESTEPSCRTRGLAKTPQPVA
ncbi:MAG: relaxase [Candidatus Competibacteraceae bacterium]|jgi:hypothetical protein|nr:relaxase [Candidatus Competibacteraceae bacterium]